MSKIRVGILFGGKSAEHEVSLQSAKSIIDALDTETYEPVLIGIDKKGQWHLKDASTYLLNAENPKLIALNNAGKDIALTPGNTSGQLVNLSAPAEHPGTVDVIFPVLHGPYGEDGSMQGLLKLSDIPFVGPGVLGSAVGMDKDVMKRLLREAGIPVTKFIAVQKHAKTAITFETVEKELGMPFFIKPANLGSSVGVVKVHGKEDFEKAMDEAFRFDTKILIEQEVKGREVECSVLGNEDPVASLPGEVVPHHEFYSYEAKYIDEKGAGLIIPAALPGEVVKEIQQLAIKAFQVLCCEGMARVDFFLTDKNEVLVNEINTIPGFTKISMYPKLWEASGIPYPELIDRLIKLAIARHERDKKLQTSL